MLRCGVLPKSYSARRRLYNSTSDQLSLFGDELAREQQTTWAIDEINQRYGARTIHAASTLNTEAVRTKIPFGSTRYL